MNSNLTISDMGSKTIQTPKTKKMTKTMPVLAFPNFKS